MFLGVVCSAGIWLTVTFINNTIEHNERVFKETGKTPKELRIEKDSSYVLKNSRRPTHWSQEEWDILDSYLKRIDKLEKQIKETRKINRLYYDTDTDKGN